MLTDFELWKIEQRSNGYVEILDECDNPTHAPLIEYENITTSVIQRRDSWINFTDIYGNECNICTQYITSILYIKAEFAQRHWESYKIKAMNGE